jgi:mycothiol synthase
MAHHKEQRGQQLCMKRSGLNDLPEIELPKGYAIRTSQAGDAQHWARILREAFADDRFDEFSFDREMRADPAYRPDRIFFVCAPSGLPCGTASAYRQAHLKEDTGHLHYVGACPAHAGRRLGAAVSVAALNKFRSEGLRSAVLLTDDFRLAAVKTYLRLGFSPLIVYEDQPERWDAVFTELQLSLPDSYEVAEQAKSSVRGKPRR